jgi:hypothetical protein
VRWIKIVVNIGLAILLLFDIVLGFHLYAAGGWPKTVVFLEIKPGMEVARVSRVPFTVTDFCVLTALAGVHVLLIHLAWRFWKPRGEPEVKSGQPAHRDA